MKETGLNYRAYRAWHRAKVRDEVRAGFNLEQQALVKLRDENAALKAKVAEIDELKLTLASMETVMQEILDEAERPQFHARKRWLAQRGTA